MADSRFARLPETIGPACRVSKSFVIVERGREGKLFVPAEAARTLRSLPGVTLSVVCIMGPMREGKSSAANLMVCSFAAGEESSPSVELVVPTDTIGIFRASDSGEGVTKGIHASIVYTSDTSAVMVLDLEGSGEAGADLDAQVAVIACCLSSVVVLNRAGAGQRTDILEKMSPLLAPCEVVASIARASTATPGEPHSETAAAAAAAAAAGPACKAPMGMLMVLLRDYKLKYSDNQVTAQVFEMDDDLGSAARNDKRSRIAAAFSKCCAKTLPFPGKTLTATGQDFDAALYSNVMPVLREQLATPTKQVGSDRDLHSRSLVPILEALCTAINSDSIARLLPADIEAAVFRSQVGAGTDDVCEAASRRADQLCVWACRCGGVPEALFAAALRDIRERAAHGTQVAGCGHQRVTDGIAAACEAPLGRLAEGAEACNAALLRSVGHRCVALVEAAVRARVDASVSLGEQRTAALEAVGRARALEAIDAVPAPAAVDGAAAGVAALEHVVAQARAAALGIDAGEAFGAPDLDACDAFDKAAEERRAEAEVVARMDQAACFARLCDAVPAGMPTPDAMAAVGAEAAEAEHRAAAEALDLAKQRARQTRADAIRGGEDACTGSARSAAEAKLAEVEGGTALPPGHMSEWRERELAAAVAAGTTAAGEWAADAEASLRDAGVQAAGLLDAVMATHRARLDGMLSDAKTQLIREATAAANRAADQALEARSASLKPAIMNAANLGAVDAAMSAFTKGLAALTPETLAEPVADLVGEAWASSSQSSIKACRDIGISLSSGQLDDVVSRVTGDVCARIPEVKRRLQAEADSAASSRRQAVAPPKEVHHHHVHTRKKRKCAVM